MKDMSYLLQKERKDAAAITLGGKRGELSRVVDMIEPLKAEIRKFKKSKTL
jgi:hypothetical protein